MVLSSDQPAITKTDEEASYKLEKCMMRCYCLIVSNWGLEIMIEMTGDDLNFCSNQKLVYSVNLEEKRFISCFIAFQVKRIKFCF